MESIEKAWGGKPRDREMCLSFPGYLPGPPVFRHRKIIVSALDRNRDPIVRRATGGLASVIQHEIDHLEGVTMYDRARMDSGRVAV